MFDAGSGFGYELYDLEKVAKDYLPTVASAYDDAVSKCKAARSDIDDAMQRPEEFGGSLGPVHAAYVELDDAVTNILSDTKANLNDTAAALSTAVRIYAESDQAAAAELRHLRSERGEPKPEDT